MSKEKVKVCIIGAGNISNTRHIPALKKVKNAEIIGVISNSEKNLNRTQKKNKFKNQLLIGNNEDDIKKLKKAKWFDEVDAVVIGVPPRQHYPLVKMCLTLGKHVLVEKPMMMNKEESDELIKLARDKKKKFCVMHNFQYASDMLKLNKIIDDKKYGEILSITEVQFTNRDRRLPEWYNDLPLGLFYDEAAHFIYLLERHAGELKIDNSYAVYTKDKEATPMTLSVEARAGEVPVHMMLNMNSPICEWYYIVNFKKQIFMYDFFKDILIKIPTDNEHLSKDILKNDISFTLQYWGKFIRNGFKMVTGNLLYGHDIVLGNFINSIITGDEDENIIAEQGRKNVISMNDIVNKVNK